MIFLEPARDYEWMRLPLGEGAKIVVDWMTENLALLFTFFRTLLNGMNDTIAWVLTTPPFWVIILALAAVAYLAKGWKLALGTILGLLVIVSVSQWSNAMSSLSLVLVAAITALVMAIPLGILAAKNDTASSIIRPILDFMQTMPAFVYLIPAIVIFRVGVVPGIVATIIFSMAPGVRLTELGIRGVDKEVVEAGYAFGSKPGRILRQIQLPLAMPSIMAGVNQVIMLALSMVVIAGMAGAGGLGADVYAAVQRIDIRLGFESGLAVVIIAMILDRVTSGFGSRSRRTAKKKPSSDAAAGSGQEVEAGEDSKLGARRPMHR